MRFHISLDDFSYCTRRVIGDGKRSTRDRQNVPYCVFMTPPLSRVRARRKNRRGAKAARSGAVTNLRWRRSLAPVL
ncbi:hypothetical protein KCP73_04740 [Salmonella enterica subsp. enterica]|nr:hypothetical protein KCP73_04740 [Salmonella enterica subsp. enterica]